MDRKSSKSQEKRLAKKERKLRLMLESSRGIVFSSEPTCFLLIGGAGLANHVSREDLDQVTSDLAGLLQLEMPENETFCFAGFATPDMAATARHSLSGAILSTPRLPKRPTVQLAGLFVNEIPSVPRADLDSSLPEGLLLRKEFLSRSEEADLLACLSWAEEEVGSSLKQRAVRHFGFEFLYGTNNVDPTRPLPSGLPPASTAPLQRLLADGCMDELPDQLTVNRYEPGQGIPPHVDTHSAFGEVLISLSCGSQTVMEFRDSKAKRKVSVLLPPRSALVLSGAARYQWSHSIAARKADLMLGDAGLPTLIPRGLRVSFTFRKVLNPPTCKCQFPDQCDFAKAKAAAAVLASAAVPRPPQPSPSASPTELEKRFVHRVYDCIADHFSATRHSPWPRVAAFLAGLPPGSLVADIGCGNGKYLGVNPDLVFISSDRSAQLCAICHERHAFRAHSFAGVVTADVLRLPFRRGAVDCALCVAVLHHLASRARRVAALRELAQLLRPGGRLLVTVWAFEQETGLAGEKGCYRYVKPGRAASAAGQVQVEACCVQEELEADREEAAGACSPLQVHTNRTAFREHDMLVPWHKRSDETLYRYYHLFGEGELDDLCEEVDGLVVVESYYDKGNWGVIAERLL